MGWTFYNSSGQRLQAFGFVAATQAEMEAGSSTTAYVTPGRTQYHPGVAKVVCKWEQAGAHSIKSPSYNMTSVTDGGSVGDTDHIIGVDFSSEHWILAGDAGAGHRASVQDSPSLTVGTFTTLTREGNSGTAIDRNTNMIVMFGLQ